MDTACTDPDLQNQTESGQWLRKRKRESGLSLPVDTPRCKLSLSIRDHDFEITDKELMSISHECGSRYLDLGISLGLTYPTIMNRVSRHEGKNEHLKAFEVLQEWKGRDFNYEVLARALENIGLNRIAAKYCYTTEGGT